MQTIEEAYGAVCKLHEQITNAPAPEIGPQMFVPFPPGIDPIAFAIEEVSHLRHMVESGQAAHAQVQPQVNWVPRACIYASDTSVQFHVEVAGVGKEDVSVTLASGEMIVRGQRRPPSVDGALQPVMVEQTYGVFERRFPVPPWCNPEKIHAKYSQGVLEIHLIRQEGENAGEFRVEIS